MHRVPAVAILACALAGGCAQRGDFGRPQATIASELVAPLQGRTRSAAPFTDDEEEMRDRAWRFLMPAKERWFFDDELALLANADLLDHPLEAAHQYKDALLDEAFVSIASRYARLAVDAAADHALIGPFAGIAAKVEATDRVRLRTIDHVATLDVADVVSARRRVRENRRLAITVCLRLRQRLITYRVALEHITIVAPQREAIAAERALIALERAAAPLFMAGCTRPDPLGGRVERDFRAPVEAKLRDEPVLLVPRAAPRAGRGLVTK